jgi:uncharacterized protein (DUF302 family)
MLQTFVFTLLILLSSQLRAENMPSFDLSQTVVKMQVADGISLDEAIESMKLRANAINLKLVAHQPMHEEHKAMGLDNIRRIEIFQFCYADIAKEMIDYDISFAAHMPCRIIALEDDEGKPWLVMTNLDLLMSAAQLPESLHSAAQKVRDALHSVMEAGANGDF